MFMSSNVVDKCKSWMGQFKVNLRQVWSCKNLDYTASKPVSLKHGSLKQSSTILYHACRKTPELTLQCIPTGKVGPLLLLLLLLLLLVLSSLSSLSLSSLLLYYYHHYCHYISIIIIIIIVVVIAVVIVIAIIITIIMLLLLLLLSSWYYYCYYFVGPAHKWCNDNVISTMLQRCFDVKITLVLRHVAREDKCTAAC